MSSPSLARLVFGLVAPAPGSGIAEGVERFTKLFGQRVGLVVEHREAASYDALGDDVRAGRVDVAWLPPIVFLRLGDVVRPLGSILRRGAAAYESVLVVPGRAPVSSPEGLRGARAGWVGRSSASGYVLPRVGLTLRGIDPRATFASESFHGSHRALMLALRDGACDVAGTYARLDEARRVRDGAWNEVPGLDVRVLSLFGEIPPDVLAVRTVLAPRIGFQLFAALRDTCRNDVALMEAIFGGQELHEGLVPGYEHLRHTVSFATSRGFF